MARVRTLLATASPPRSLDLVALQHGVEEALATVPQLRAENRWVGSYPIRRCTLLNEVRRKTRYFGLEDEATGFCLAAGCETPGGLELAQLEALSRWLDGLIAQQDMACDSPMAPPAR